MLRVGNKLPRSQGEPFSAPGCSAFARQVHEIVRIGMLMRPMYTEEH